MRGFKPFARFTKGIITDKQGVPGALLKAVDMVPQRSGDYWMIRPPLQFGYQSSVDGYAVNVNPVAQAFCAATNLQVYPNGSGQQAAVFMAEPSTGVMQLRCFGSGASIGLGLTQYATDHAAAAIPVATPSGNNNLQGPYSVGQDGMQYAQELWLPAQFSKGALGLPSRWAGNVTGTERAPAATLTGSLNGSVITASASTFVASDAGMYVYINAATVKERQFRIVQVLSTTQAIVDAPLGAAFAAVAWKLTRSSWWSVFPGTFGGGANGTYTSPTSFGYLNARSVCAHAGATIAAGTVDNDGVFYPDRVRISYANADFSGQWKGCERWHPNAYIDVEPGVGGQTGALAVISNGVDLLVFKERMVFAIRGALSPDGTDLGARVERVLETDGLLTGKPVATPNGIVFIGQKGVYRIGQGTVENLTNKGGVRKLFYQLAASQIGYVDGRVFVIGSRTRSAAVSAGYPNVMVFDDEYGVWYSWLSLKIAPPLQTPGGAYVLCVDSSGPGEASALADRLTDTGAGGTDIYTNSIGGQVNVSYRGQLVTHELQLPGDMNARVRAVQVRGQIQDDGSASGPGVTATILTGEDGTETTVATAQGQFDTVAQAGRADRWQRLPVRSGCPPIASMRVQLDHANAVGVYKIAELGVEHVSVGRTR